MNLKQLEAFVKIADTGSFSQAAKELYLTQPTISAHISSLEKELNSRLFVRNTKEVHLSENGNVLYNYAKQMLVLQKRIEETFKLNDEKEQQCITIAASTIPAQYILPEILVAFNEKYPEQQFKVVETDSVKVVEHVMNHTADVGFTGTALDKKVCKHIPFYQDELVVIAPHTEKYLALQKNEKDATWLANEKLIMREEGSGTRKEAEKLLKKIGLNASKLNIIATMENPEAIKKAVANGMGVSVISKLATEEAVDSGNLLVLPLTADGTKRDINVVYDRNLQPSRTTERFIKLVKELHKQREQSV